MTWLDISIDCSAWFDAYTYTSNLTFFDVPGVILWVFRPLVFWIDSDQFQRGAKIPRWTVLVVSILNLARNHVWTDWALLTLFLKFYPFLRVPILTVSVEVSVVTDLVAVNQLLLIYENSGVTIIFRRLEGAQFYEQSPDIVESSLTEFTRLILSDVHGTDIIAVRFWFRFVHFWFQSLNYIRS